MSKRAKSKELKKYDKILGEGKLVYDMTEEEQCAPITKKIGKLCKHRLERRWYRRLIELNILIIVVVLMVLFDNLSKDLDFVKRYAEQTVNEFLDEEDKKTSEKKDDEDKLTSDDIPFELKVVAEGVFILVVGYIGLYVYYAMYRSMSLRITERNFPEVYKTIEEYSRRLGIKTPKAYVMQKGGVLNAFSTFLFKRQWLSINAELFEVAYRENKDMDSLNFVIAHELSHIYYGHATLHYNLPIWFADRIPVIGAIASRTREYSCDRLAQRLSGVSGISAMLVLVVDRHLYKMVDEEDYINELKSVRGFFVWAYNMFADHPIMSKRVIALKEGRGSGALY